MADIQAGNLYDMNKMLVAKNEKHLRGKALQNKMEQEVIPYLQTKTKETYFMILCHEKHDYIVFHINRYDIKEIIHMLKVWLHNRGAIYSIDRTQDKIALEIWIRANDNKEMACYYFFPYTQAVIETENISVEKLYDMNKRLMAKNEKHLQNKMEQEVISYLQTKTKEIYFMILCHEKRDYTILHINQYSIEKIMNILKLCLHNRGTIYGIDKTQDKTKLKFWIRADDNKEMACYCLFPYTQAIVEIGSVNSEKNN